MVAALAGGDLILDRADVAVRLPVLGGQSLKEPIAHGREPIP